MKLNTHATYKFLKKNVNINMIESEKTGKIFQIVSISGPLFIFVG